MPRYASLHMSVNLSVCQLDGVRIVASVDWKWLLHGRLRLAASVYKANIVLRETSGKAATQNLPDLASTVTKILPGQLHRLQLRDSEVTYIFHNEKDAKALQTQAHSLKSSSANVGARELAELARELEALGRTGQTTDAAGLVERMATEFLRVREALVAERERGVA